MLKRCSEYGMKKLASKYRIICYGNTKWLERLMENYEISKSVCCVIDDNPHIWGQEFLFGTKKIKIQEPALLKKMELDNAIIIITASYQEKLYKKVCSYLEGRNCSVFYCPSIEDQRLLRFRNVFLKLKPRDMIVFRSGLQKYSEPWEYSDNARALFEYMIKNGYNLKYKLLWVVKYPQRYKWLEKNKNVKVISYDWEQSRNIVKAMIYQYYIYCAKYFFFTETCNWVRYAREEQVTVNLWHGCGIKGRKAKTEPTGTHYDYMTVNSPLYAEIHARQYGCEMRQMLITGLPKQDWLFDKIERDISDILRVERQSKTVFWLPTFRKAQRGFENLNERTHENQTGLPLLDIEADVERLNKILSELEMLLVIKLHPIQDDLLLKNHSYSNIIFLSNEDMQEIGYSINQLLTFADAMISDYSSAAIDYAMLDRPIGFTLDDLEQYESGREFNFDNLHEYLPGEELYSFEELVAFLKDISIGNDSSREKRNKIVTELHAYTDGNACKRIVDYFKL